MRPRVAAPTDPDVRHERIRVLGHQRLGIPLAPHCAALHGQSAVVDALECGQDVRRSQLLDLLPTSWALAATTTPPVPPRLLRLATDFLQQTKVPSDTVVPEMPTPLQAEPVVLVLQRGVTMGVAPPP